MTERTITIPLEMAYQIHRDLMTLQSYWNGYRSYQASYDALVERSQELDRLIREEESRGS